MLSGELIVLQPERPMAAAATSLEPARSGANNDADCIHLWLHGRALLTIDGYTRDIASFRSALPKTLAQVTLADLQQWDETLYAMAPATRARKLAAVKSLLRFAHRIGYLTFDVGSAIRLPKIKDTINERRLAESDVHRMLVLETHPRNNVLLRLAYGCGLRISEICALRWRDATAAPQGGALTVFGKGGKTRFVLMKPRLWEQLLALRGAAGPDDPLFRSRENGPLARSQVHNIAKAAARRAGLSAEVSLHWLRHAHASHALDRKAPVHVVKETLGHSSLTTTSRYAHAKPDDSSGLYLAE